MKLDPARAAEFRQALTGADTAAFSLVDVEIFPGATRYSKRSTLVCTFDTKARASLAAAGEEAARLAGSQLGVQITWGVRADPGQPLVLWIEYFPGGARNSSARFALQALQTAFLVVAAAGSEDEPLRQAANRELKRLENAPVQNIFLQSKFLISAARSADIPVDNLGGSSAAWQFGWGSRSEIFFMTASLTDSVPGHQMTWRKHVAKELFREIGLPTPGWRLLAADGDALRTAQEVGWPCVVKPVDQAFGSGVTANIASPGELQAAVALARRLSRQIIVEAHEPGADYRLMVVDGRLVAAARRNPPVVTGDGKRTLKELIAELNSGRDGTRESGYLLPVKPDSALETLFASRGLSLDSVLPKGSTLALRSVANFSSGGSAIDVTSFVHPQIRGLAELLAAAVGLRTAGIDYITTDISRSHSEVGGGFIEVNAMPRLRLLMTGSHTEEAIGALVLGHKPCRIPVTLIVGDSKAVAEVSGPIRMRVAANAGSAAVSLNWARIGATQLPSAGSNAFAAVSTVLRHLAVDELFILWTPAEIQRFGLPVDTIEKAVVIGADNGLSCLPEICRDIVVVGDCDAAIEAVFGSHEMHASG